MCLVIPYFAIYTFLPTILKAIHLNNDSSADFLLNEANTLNLQFNFNRVNTTLRIEPGTWG